MMQSGDEPVELLPSATPDGAARRIALLAAARMEASPTSLVEYRSAGTLLIIGPEEHAIAVARRLRGQAHCTVLAVEGAGSTNGSARREDARSGTGTEGAPQIYYGRPQQVTGHFGAFTVTVATAAGEINLAQLAVPGRGTFDLVLDLSAAPFMRAEIPPIGYYAPCNDAAVLQRALNEIPVMVGDFEKPKFFRYNPDICAHGASGLKGCTRCIDACPTWAITSAGERISVDPYLCQGAGSCATACPTGAITYAYPGAADTLARVRELLTAYREAGGRRACLLLHDAEQGWERLARIAAQLPERVMPLGLAELGSVGMEVWFAALAYGAAEVALLVTPAVAPSVLKELKAQLGFARAILQGMGYSAERLLLLGEGEDAALADALCSLPIQAELSSATFAALDEKRTTARLAVDHLYEQAPAKRSTAPLPLGAPYGDVQVDRSACTLCMACVSICPTRALTAGNGVPQLNFNEPLCVQCGLCTTACPEHAIALAPRYLYDPEQRRKTRVLNEEPAFHCVSCGKPFATRSVIERMTERLKGHLMFQGEPALRRLQMCDDCRVRDMFRPDGSGAQPRPPLGS